MHESCVQLQALIRQVTRYKTLLLVVAHWSTLRERRAGAKACWSTHAAAKAAIAARSVGLFQHQAPCSDDSRRDA
ncbi:hypothetical protein [Luteimonas terrae]|uniref:Uncharacterized protein n=1 Tax=Luteimonas terrae TaxID=1530191 RepID=A0ABU1XRE4_9GAMM|nr:hypothetical protein [Luteimonas terrae]MDR7191328.1 hypothetical protein [Luteimonas terrae]